MDFLAIDVETANSNYASICQIGIVGYSNGLVIKEYETLVNPEDHFDDVNIEIHGIDPSDVRHSPTFPDIYHIIVSLLEDNMAVCHTMFDKLSLNGACSKYNLAPVSCAWLNSASVARRAWRQFARQGYSLLNLCEFLEYKFKHHDALEDAKAAGHIVLIRVGDWLERIKPSPAQHVKRGGKRSAH
jgi:DNA polymerase-3 subunit epsilon